MTRAESDSFLLANYQANSSVIYRIFFVREARRLAMTPREQESNTFVPPPWMPDPQQPGNMA